MSELVQKLAKGDSRVVFETNHGEVLEELKASVDRGYVLIKFTETQGGTVLGIRLEDGSDTSGADFEKGTGNCHFVGRLILDYVPVRLVADIDVATMEGKGHLEILEGEEAQMDDDDEADA